MVTVSYPGVYIQEVPSGVRTVTGVSTSIGAFFGRATKGPINGAVRLLSFADFERRFGGPTPGSDLAHSVRMFFNNGGTDCYVVRLASGAEAADMTIRSLAGGDVLVAAAKAEGLYGNTIRLGVDYNTQRPDETFNLTVIQEENGVPVSTETFTGLSMDPASARFAPDFVSQSSQLVDLSPAAALGDPAVATDPINDIAASAAGYSAARRPLRNPLNDPAGATNGAAIQAALNDLIAAGNSRFDISVNGSTYRTVDLGAAPAIPASIAAIETNIADKINTALAANSPAPTVTVDLGTTIAGVGRMMRIVANSGDQSTVHVRPSATNDAAGALMLGVDQGGIEFARRSNFRPAPTATIVRLGDPAIAGDLSDIDALTGLQQSTVTSLDIDGGQVDLDVAPYVIQTTAGGEPWSNGAPGSTTANGDNDGVREKLRIIAQAITNDTDVSFNAEVWGYTLALEATDGTINNAPTAISSTAAVGQLATGGGNGVIPNVRRYTLGPNPGPNLFSVPGTPGLDGNAPMRNDYIGSEAQQTGFHALDPVDLFNLMVLPGDADVSEADMLVVLGAASNYCERHRAFLLIDSPQSWTDNTGRPAVVQDTGLVNTLRGFVVNDHAAVFYPRLRINDNGLSRTIGASGAIAGLMARTDSNRGVWKAPAGIEADIRDVIGVNLELTDAENGVLNKKGVNCIRVFPNGIVNWGGRTLDGDDDFGSEWKYVPIRRLALMIEESLYRGTRWAVFEPNDEPLWANLRLNIGAFMFSLFRQGAFQGTGPSEAFFVKCDKQTTTQDDRNRGIVNIEVGFAPLKPAEFIVIKIQQIAGEIQT